ncbi:MAG TPA: acyltransferase [Chthonomonadaceae bacterium]|nr:acyltransferase [Chthonomonadaceae bacterium]
MSASLRVREAAEPPPRETPRLRLEFLDGLRGLAALYVVLYHTVQYVGPGLSPLAQAAIGWMRYGHYAVCVFIVLSGYCLMLPVARSADGQLRGGFWPYIKRRARRILPPYYAALAISLLLVVLVESVKGGDRSSETWATNFSPGVLLSHLFVVHNLWFDWHMAIDPPMWSVATEWQIYFLFPLLLLPVWRKGGVIALFAVSFVLSYAPRLLLPADSNLDWACPWFIGLFAMGMAGAVVGFSQQPAMRAWRERIPWGLWAFALFGAICGILACGSEGMHDLWIMDVLVGMFSACLILYCALAAGSRSEARRPWMLRLLETRGAVLLGTFSYSLYLIHFPALYKFFAVLGSLRLPPLMELVFRIGVGVPLALSVSYLFHLAFERRFMPGHPHTERQAAKSAALSPAP